MKHLLFILFIAFASCQMPDILPIDFLYTPKIMCDSAKVASDSLLVQIGVCDTVVTQPEFITMYNEYFNGLPDTLVWFYYTPQGQDVEYPTLDSLLSDLGYDSIQVFEEGNSIAAIIHGTNDKSPIENIIWTRDAIGQKAFFVTNIQAFLFGGALTFEEYRQVAIELQSVAVFNFRNTNWTQAQYEEVALIILGECKLGRRDANFAFNAFPISDELYCKFIDRFWQVVRGQVENCNVTPFNKTDRT